MVRLEIARDDNGALSDAAVQDLTARLTEDRVQPALSRGESGTILVQMTVTANTDIAAQSAAESLLRARANTIWLGLGLPPFTITFVEAKLAGRG